MSNAFVNLLAFIPVIGVIIFVHEAGHFVVAKAFGMKVLAFSLGFGKRIFGFTRGETEYRVGVLPLGGYVKLSGEEPDEAGDDPRDFLNRPRWQRILVYLAGPTMNALFSVLVIAGLFVVGIDVPALQSIPTVVGEVEAGSPGAAAGVVPGDEIVAVAGAEVDRWQDVAFTVMTSIGRPVELTLERDGQRRTVSVTPVKPADYDFGDIGVFPKILPKIGVINAGSPSERAGLLPGDEVHSVDGRPVVGWADFVNYIQPRTGVEIAIEVERGGARHVFRVVPETVDGVGRIGANLTFEQRFPPGRALVESVRFNLDIARQSLAVVGKIFKREVAAKSALSGPIEIAAQSGAAARSGIKHLLYLMGVISISIGLLNLFPVPVLDGGQIAILLVESVARRDLSMGVKVRIAQVGFALIVLLMVTVIWFDLSKNLFSE